MKIRVQGTLYLFSACSLVHRFRGKLHNHVFDLGNSLGRSIQSSGALLSYPLMGVLQILIRVVIEERRGCFCFCGVGVGAAWCRKNSSSRQKGIWSRSYIILSTLFASQQIIRHCITNKYDERFLTLRFRKGAYHVPLTANVVCLKVCLRSVFKTKCEMQLLFDKKRRKSNLRAPKKKRKSPKSQRAIYKPSRRRQSCGLCLSCSTPLRCNYKDPARPGLGPSACPSHAGLATCPPSRAPARGRFRARMRAGKLVNI